jgi:Predicted hydrolases or acyltransferases (alpha/beta hydrolase superfamily)
MRFAELRDAAIVGHSMGGMVGLVYAGTYPDRVSRLALLDGAFLSNSQPAAFHEQMSRWIGQLDRISEHQSSAFKTIEEAAQRLSARNKRLTPELALHLARHGVRRDADGFYRWKFDHYQRARAPYRLSPDDYAALWSRIACPTLLMWGSESFLPDPEAAGLLAHFKDAELVKIAGAGHWLHHDRLDEVLTSLRRLLGTAPSTMRPSGPLHPTENRT